MDGVEHRLRLLVPGHHNVLNATAAFVAATAGLGQDPEPVLAGLASFSGTRRRFEPKGQRGRGRRSSTTTPTTRARWRRSSRRPPSWSRTPGPAGSSSSSSPTSTRGRATSPASSAAGLAAADVVVVMDVYAAREDPQPGVSGRLVAEAVRAARPDADVHYVPSWAAVPAVVAGLVRPGDLLLTVGAGDVTMIGPEVLYRLEHGEVGRGGRLRAFGARGRRTAAMSERPRWLTEAARSGAAVDEVPEPRPGAGPGGRGVPPARRLGRLRRAGRRSGADVSRSRFERRAASVRRRPKTLIAVGAGLVVLARRAGLAGVVQLAARHPDGDRDRPRRPGGAGGGRGRRGGADRHPPGPSRHRRRRRPRREDPDRGLGVGEPVVAVDGGRLGAAQGPGPRHQEPSRSTTGCRCVGRPVRGRERVAGRRRPGQRRVRRARPRGASRPPSRSSSCCRRSGARRSRGSPSRAPTWSRSSWAR